MSARLLAVALLVCHAAAFLVPGRGVPPLRGLPGRAAARCPAAGRTRALPRRQVAIGMTQQGRGAQNPAEALDIGACVARVQPGT